MKVIRKLTEHSEVFERTLLASLVISLPLVVGISSVIVGLIALYWILARKFTTTLEVLKDSSLLKLFLAYFFVLILSAITSADLKEGVRLLEKRINLIAIPLTIVSFTAARREKWMLLNIFIGLCVCCAIYSILSTYIIHDFNIQKLLSDRENLSYYSWIIHQSLGLNTSYYALFVAFAAILSAYFGLFNKKVVYLMVYLFLFFFMALLGSRISLVAMLLLSLMILAVAFYKGHISLKQTSAILALGIIFAIGFMKVPYLNSRFAAAITALDSDPRNMTFDCAFDVIRQKPFFGHGLGDVEKAALACYLEKGYTEPFQDQYNFHNEFLEITASSGIVGLLIFLMLLWLLLRKAFLSGDIISIAFLLQFIIACQTESLLDRNKGVLFFALFSTLLIIIDDSKKGTPR